MTPVLIKLWVEPLSKREIVAMDADTELHYVHGVDAGYSVQSYDIRRGCHSGHQGSPHLLLGHVVGWVVGDL